MKRSVVTKLLLAIALLVLAGCGQSGLVEEEAKHDEAKAAAAQEELTLADLEKLDGSTNYEMRLVSGLGNCQVNKYIAENGKAAWDEYFAEYSAQVGKWKPNEVISLQEVMMRDGYSCTVPESMAAYGQ